MSFYQRLILFSISNAFKKLNQRQHNLTHIICNVMVFLKCALHFPIFLANLDQRTIQFDSYWLILLRLFWWFSRKTYFLISPVSSIKFCSKDNMVWPLGGFWILLILKLNFKIVYYSATPLCLTSFHGMAALNFQKQTFGRNHITLLDSFLKFYRVT